MNEEPPPVRAERERIFNAPAVIVAVVGSLMAIQIITDLLPRSAIVEIYSALALVPARISYVFAPEALTRAISEAVGRSVEKREIAAIFDGDATPWWTLLTYAFLHSGWTHLVVDCVTLAAFGTPLARRFGPARFLAFFAATAIAGALACLAVQPFDIAPVGGASAAVSGTMAASARFAFAPGAPLGEPGPRSSQERGDRGAKASALSDLLSNRRALVFLASWFGINLLFGLFPGAAGATDRIAWEAHLGGFCAGLLLFGLFDAPTGIRDSGMGTTKREKHEGRFRT